MKVCTISIVVVTCLHVTIVLDKQIYTFYYNTHTVTQSTIANRYLVQVLLVNYENSSKSVKSYSSTGTNKHQQLLNFNHIIP